jgi:hypothetical protein
MHKLAEWLGCWAGEEVMRNLLVGVGGGLWRLFRRPTQTISEGEPMSEQKKFDPMKPVQTRDGRPARILATDLRNTDYPIAAVIASGEGSELTTGLNTFTADGFHDLGSRPGLNGSDLVNVPQKVCFWTNLYRNAEGTHSWVGGGFATQEDARSCAQHVVTQAVYVGPILIEHEV